MKIGKELINGKEQLWLKTENGGETELVKGFAKSEEPLLATVFYCDGDVYPLVVIRKETD